MSDDASATYRGYRKQALYVLSRILTDKESDQQIYHPEGSEDLAVYDLEQRLVEVVQVKDYTSDLALSHFKPRSPEGFFARMQERRKMHPDCAVRLASFGPLGPELKRAIEGEKKERRLVVEKLSKANAAISHSEAADMLDSLKEGISHPMESQLQESILCTLEGTIGGGFTERSFELLLYWVFDASEQRQAIMRSSMLLQLERIGEYLAALRDSSSEWMTTVQPISVSVQSEDEQLRLKEEYVRGVQARWAHIVAGVDCPRLERLADIHAEFQRHSVVIIRGASGQGKSSLGWRYLHDYSADGLRFQIRLVNGREHALSVAHALQAHVQRLRLKAVVWIDLGPSDSGWLELLSSLADTGIKILVAVREEDFRRSGVSVDELNYGEVPLDIITAPEAELIFNQLVTAQSTTALDFLDAWSRFGGASGGPLLEFTHLVTQGDTLAAKLDKQMQRLADEAATGSGRLTPRHLQALALASLAHSAGCRVDAARLCAIVGLDSTLRPFSYLEREYLLRASEGGAIAGLHALRSGAIIRALLDNVPERWPELAAQCLPLVLDEDLESFLLHAFSRFPEHGKALRTTLADLQLRSWTQAGGIGRALLWIGLSEHAEENQEVLVRMIKEYEGSWIFLCDCFVGGGSDSLMDLRKMLSRTGKKELPLFNLTPKEHVYAPLRAWITTSPAPDKPPSNHADWLAVGDLAYWSGGQMLSGAIPQALKGLFPETLPTDMKLAELGQLVSGLHALDPVIFSEWHDRQASFLKSEILQQTGSLHLEDDGFLVKIIFPIYLSGDDNDGMGERRALRLLHLVHDLFPHRKKVGTEGVGAEFLKAFTPFDLTKKEVDSSRMPSTRAAGINKVFQNIVAYRYRRLATWREYADRIVTLRASVNEAFRGLHRGWGRMIGQRVVKGDTIAGMPGRALEKIQELSERPMLPRIAVDEWGYASEDNVSKATESESGGQISLQRFDQWRKSFGNYATAVNGMVQPSIEQTAVFAVLKNLKISDPVAPDDGRLMLNNIGDGWQALDPMQREFRRHFVPLMTSASFDELERNEQANFRHLWAVAFWLVREPRRVAGNPAVEGEQRIDRQRERFLKALEAEVIAALGGSGFIGVRLAHCREEDEPCLVLVCDHATVSSLTNANAQLLPALWRAAHSQAWRPLEWTPLVVAWPRLLVLHLLRGQAIASVGIKHYLSTIFLRSEVSEPAAHEVVALPVSSAALAEASVTINPSPLIAATFAWQGAMMVFSISLMRVSALVNVLGNHKVEQKSLDAVLARISREISEGLNAARKAEDSLVDLLKPMSQLKDTGLRAVSWLEQINAVSAAALLSSNDETIVQVDLERYTEWLDCIDSHTATIEAIASEIIDAYG